LKDKVLITGYNGALAKQLKFILEKNFNVVSLTTNKSNVNKKDVFFWNIENNEIDTEALQNCKYIVHLAGFSITKKWTKKNRIIMHDSRIKSAELILDHCKRLKVSLNAFISASATGYYGMNVNGIQNESDMPGTDWIANMCNLWEKSADKFKSISKRIIKMRISILIDKNSGFVKDIRKPLRLGIAPILGTGKENMDCIHIKDAARFIKFSITNSNINGVFNIANSKKITQYELIKVIRNIFSPKAILIMVPKFLIRFVLGKKARLILSSYNLSTTRITDTGFIFKYQNFTKDIL